MPPSPLGTVLVIDGDPGDEAAVIEACRRSTGKRDRVEVFLVPVMLNEWAHWELGDNPNLLRFQIEYEQVKWVTERFEAHQHFDGCAHINLLRSRWKDGGQLRQVMATGDLLIVSTSSALVRLRVSRLADRVNLSTLVIK